MKTGRAEKKVVPSPSLGTRDSARKYCIHRHLHRVFRSKTRVATGWQLTEYSKTSHHHVTTDQLSDQLQGAPTDPSNRGNRRRITSDDGLADAQLVGLAERASCLTTLAARPIRVSA